MEETPFSPPEVVALTYWMRQGEGGHEGLVWPLSLSWLFREETEDSRSSWLNSRTERKEVLHISCEWHPNCLFIATSRLTFPTFPDNSPAGDPATHRAPSHFWVVDDYLALP